jgi:hypothetical protein
MKGPRIPKFLAVIFLVVGISLLLGAVPHISPPVSRPKTTSARLQNLPLVGTLIGVALVVIGVANLVGKGKRF